MEQWLARGRGASMRSQEAEETLAPKKSHSEEEGPGQTSVGSSKDRED